MYSERAWLTYYRCYIPNFTSVAVPVMGLTKKDAKLIWDNNFLRSKIFGTNGSASVYH